MSATQSFRRIVTGHDPSGRAMITQDAPPTRAVEIGGPGGAMFYEVWHTRETPAVIDRQSGEPAEDGLVLGPPERGTRLRVIDFPPEDDRIRNLSGAEAVGHFAQMGGTDAARSTAGGPHPLMHRTQTLDYAIVIDGELTLVLDDSETVLRAGDIVIQRGTSHAWANRSAAPCRVAFMLIDGQYTDGL